MPHDIKSITETLYADIPQETLYHYTTFKGLLGIVQSGTLWATDIRYMNDSAELRHSADLIRTEVAKRIAAGSSHAGLLNQFLDWVSYRVTSGHLVFAASFRSHGNLLSQWRGYSRLGKGVSLGFNPDYILGCAREQSFQIGKCVYNKEEQRKLIVRVVDAVEALAREEGGSERSGGRRQATAYHDIFEKIESDLLRIAAVLKHPAFEEEEEWRIVSPVMNDYFNAPVMFREGTSMLVPYIAFILRPEEDRAIALEHVFLGPTPNINISMNSVKMYLAKNRVNPRQGITYCQIPFRQK